MASVPEVDHWRDDYDYRREYFRKNPGLFGMDIWFCSQCAKPLFGKEQVEVDHGFPPSFFVMDGGLFGGGKGKKTGLFGRMVGRVINKVGLVGTKVRNSEGQIVSNTSVLARGMNKSFNLVPCCKKCNRSKSDKIGFMTYKAVFAKLLDVTRVWIQKGAAVTVALGVKALLFTVGNAAKLIAKPLTGKNPWQVKLGVIVVYAGLIWYGINRLQQ